MATIPLSAKAIISTTYINAFDICNGRLTLTTGTPVTTTDVTGAGTLYWTPYKGSYVAIYNGTQWLTYQFSELSLSLSGFTAGHCYDIFVSISGGVPTLTALDWGGSSSRGTALTLQNGVYVLSGTTTKRYLGTIYIYSTGLTSDAGTTVASLGAGRFVWNYYNRVIKTMLAVNVSTWSYNGGPRQANNSTFNQLNCAIGLVEDMVSANLGVTFQTGSGGSGAFNARMGLNSTTTQATNYISSGDGGYYSAGTNPYNYTGLSGSLTTFPALGLNTITWVESSNGNSWTVLGGGGLGGTVVC